MIEDTLKGKQAIFESKRHAVMRELARPEPGAKEFRVHTEWSLISPGTELALYLGTHIGFSDPENTFAEYPLRPGYATVGTIDAVGAEVASSWRLGTRVLAFCSHATWNTLNPDQVMVTALPEGVSPDLACFARLAQIAATATVVLPGRLPESLVILGAGLVGNLCAQAFVNAGFARVYIQDIDPERLALARACGLEVIDGREEACLPQRYAEIFGEAGPDCVVEATGVPALITQAAQLVCRRGTVLLLGSTRGKELFDFYKLVHCKGITITGAHETLPPNSAPADEPSRHQLLAIALKQLAQGTLRVKPLVRKRIAPDELPQTYEELSQGGGAPGVLVRWR